MEIEKYVDELSLISEDLNDLDETTKEYTTAINNAAKLQGIIVNDYELKNKAERYKFDKEIRERQMTLDESKHTQECERQKMQHEERMAEIRVSQLKAENEQKLLEQNQQRAEKEFKSNRRRDIISLVTKITCTGLIVGSSLFMHGLEIYLERKENGITPKRCSVYDATVNKAAEIYK